MQRPSVLVAAGGVLVTVVVVGAGRGGGEKLGKKIFPTSHLPTTLPLSNIKLEVP